MNPIISVVLPAFKRFDLFCRTIQHNYLFTDPRCEVILVLDEPSELDLYLGLIRGHWHNHIRFKVLVNEEPHKWRPPCKAINVGIRHAEGEYCVVMSPESILMLPSGDYMWQKIHQLKWRKFFLTGLVGEVSPDRLHPTFTKEYYDEIITGPIRDEFGFLLASRYDLVDLGGYDERRVGYGGDDDDIRRRLERHGIKHVNDSQLRVAHFSHSHAPRRDGSKAEPIAEEIVMPNQPVFGMDFARVAWNWRDK